MSKIDPRHGWLLAGGLFAIGLSIHGCRIALEQRFPSSASTGYRPQENRVVSTPAPQSPPPSIARPQESRSTPPSTHDSAPPPERTVYVPVPVRTEPPKPREKTPEELAAEHRQFLAQYYDPSFTRKPGTAAVAFVVASDAGSRPVSEALTQHFLADGIPLLSAFFKPRFAADGFLARIVAGDTEPIEQLDLAKALDGLLLAQETVEYEDNPQLENVISAHLHLRVVALPLAAGRQSQTWTFTANGAGFNNGAARTMAEERLCKQIAGDTKMSLAPVFGNR